MDELIQIVKEFLKVDIDENSKLGDFEKWDSLGHLNLFMKLENEYNTKFEIDEIMNAKSIKNIYKLLEGKNV